MNLSELLSYADIHHLNRLALRLECQCDSHSKQQLIQTILHKMSRVGVMGTVMEELLPEEQLFLLQLVLDRREKFSMEDLMAKAHSSVEAARIRRQPRYLIHEALSCGWLFRGIGRGEQHLFLLPSDFRRRVLQQIPRTFSSQLVMATAQPQKWRDEGDSLLHDLYTYLNYLQHEEVPLTTEGQIYKRHLQAILSRMSVEESLPEGGGWRFGYGFHFKYYPDRFSLIHDIAKVRQLTEEGDGCLRLTAEGHMVLSGKKKLQMPTLYQVWMRIYKRAIPLLPVYVPLVVLLGQEGWIQLDSLGKMLKPWILPFYYDSPEQIFRLRLIKMCVHLGLLQIAEEQGQHWIQTSEEGLSWFSALQNFEERVIDTTK